MTSISRRVQKIAAASCALVALGYVVAGSGLVAVTVDQPAGPVPPLLAAAVAFAVLAVGTLLAAKRWLWAAGAALQLLVPAHVRGRGP